MSIEISPTADGIGVLYTSSGVLTGEELIAADARIREAVRHNPRICYLLVDHSEVSEERIDPASIRGLSEGTRETLGLIPDGIVAIAAPTEALFGLSRMWQILADQPKLVARVMRTRGEAISWLKGELERRNLPFILSE